MTHNQSTQSASNPIASASTLKILETSSKKFETIFSQLLTNLYPDNLSDDERSKIYSDLHHVFLAYILTSLINENPELYASKTPENIDASDLDVLAQQLTPAKLDQLTVKFISEVEEDGE